VKQKKSTRSTRRTSTTRLLRDYRHHLAELLSQAEVVAPREPAELRLAVAALVEGLNRDLLRLYRLAEGGTLTREDQLIAMPALERLRDALRHRGARLAPISDTLHKAIATLPAGS
jgi:hypothetical protein